MHLTFFQMSEEQLKAFLGAVEADAGLQEKLKAAADSDAVVAIAKAAGFVISSEVLEEQNENLSAEALEGVVGGVSGLAGGWGAILRGQAEGSVLRAHGMPVNKPSDI